MKDCCSLEIAKKLKDAGWGINGFFVWKIGKATGIENLRISYEAGDDTEHFDFFFAPTIGELAHALPMDIHIDKLTRDGKECYRVTLTQDEKMDYDTIEDTLADTLGMCLVRLMKDGYKPYV